MATEDLVLKDEKENYVVNRKYEGDLRIIGIIIDEKRNPLGYLLYIEKSGQTKVTPINMTIKLLTQYKFVNAELQDGKIINTECAMNKLMHFKTTGGSLVYADDISKIHILGRITGDKSGFLVLSSVGKVTTLSKEDIIRYEQQMGVAIVNGHIKQVGDNYTVSANKLAFPEIRVEKVNQMLSKGLEHSTGKRKGASFEERKKRALIYRNRVKAGLANFAVVCQYANCINAKDENGEYINLKRAERSIIVPTWYGGKTKEYYYPLFNKVLYEEILPNILTTAKSSILESAFNYSKTLDYKSRLIFDSFIVYELWGKYQKSAVKGYAKFVHSVVTERLLFNIFSSYFDNSPLFKARLTLELNKGKDRYVPLDMIDTIRDKKVREQLRGTEYEGKYFNNKRIDYKHTNYKSKEYFNSIGFSLGKSEHKDLANVLAVIPDKGYFKENAYCIGDFAWIYYVEKYLAYINYNRGESDYSIYSSFTYFNPDCNKASIDIALKNIECILAVASIIRPQNVKHYLDIKNEPMLYNMLPNFDFDNPVDYKVSPEFVAFFKSGLAYIADFKVKSTSGLTPKRLQSYAEEIASTILLVTSGNITADFLEGVVDDGRFNLNFTC